MESAWWSEGSKGKKNNYSVASNELCIKIKKNSSHDFMSKRAKLKRANLGVNKNFENTEKAFEAL